MKELIFFTIVMGIIGFIAYMIHHDKKCEEQDDDEETDIIFTAILNGSSETPPTGSEATGIATLIFNDIAKTFTLEVGYSTLILTGAHIHVGAIGVSGPVIFPLDHTVNPIIYTSNILTPEEVADLKANLYYVNLHTELYPDGEIRGQLIY